jgi:superfamily II DNA or RNA helicase
VVAALSYRGAVLADPVGSGKTYVALAAAYGAGGRDMFIPSA